MREERSRKPPAGQRRPGRAPVEATGGAETDEVLAGLERLVERLALVAPRPHQGLGPEALLTAARQAYEARRKRQRIFGGTVCGDPSWDILLNLFIARLEGRKISVSSACIAAFAPSTTALRYIAHLTQAGLISRQPHPSDARSTYLELSQEGTAKLAEFFSE
jgi:hypothetical protein